MHEGIPTLVVLLILSGFFSGVETALVSVSAAKLNLLLHKKRKGAVSLQKLKDNPHKMLSTILIGNNLVNIGAAALATKIMLDYYGDNAIAIATGVLTVFILIFGEITPKSIATRNSVKISLSTAPLVLLLSKILTPIIWILDLFTLKIINAIAGPPPEQKVTEDELKNYIKMSEQSGSINKEETEMLQNIIEFEDLCVKEIMTPKPDVKFVQSGYKLKRVVEYIIKTGHSRLPVMDNEGHVKGLVHVKEFLSEVNSGRLDKRVDEVMHDALFVPETKKLDELLKQFRRGKTHMAIVVDEFGTVTGIVTLEDLLEEIVGDLFDETDKPLEVVKQTKEGKYIVTGTTYLTDLNEELGINLDTSTDIESIGGYVSDKLGKIPSVGNKLEERGIVYTVKEMEDNRVVKLEIHIKRRMRK